MHTHAYIYIHLCTLNGCHLTISKSFWHCKDLVFIHAIYRAQYYLMLVFLEGNRLLMDTIRRYEQSKIHTSTCFFLDKHLSDPPMMEQKAVTFILR